jgi:uncharacterized membrane protein
VNTLVKTFLKGLLAFLPIFLTVYTVYKFGGWLNGVSDAALLWLAPGLPRLPGLGIVIGVVAIFVLGVVVSSRLTSWIYNLVESPLRHLPVVKDLYAALKQLITLLGPAEKDAPGQVVRLKHPDYPLSLVGLVMRSEAETPASGIVGDGLVAVYLPLSYQIGGYTVFVPRAWLTPVEMTVEAAMRSALTGWMKNDPSAMAVKSSTHAGTAGADRPA